MGEARASVIDDAHIKVGMDFRLPHYVADRLLADYRFRLILAIPAPMTIAPYTALGHWCNTGLSAVSL